jgi:uncharacterized membrane protein
MHRIKLIIISLLWLAWSIDAWYLTNEAYKIKEKFHTFWNFWWKEIWMACDVNSTFSCSSVFKEDFAWIFWLPFSGIALTVYPIIAIIAVLGFLWIIKKPFFILLIIAILWLIFNLYVILNEYFIWSYCLLCLICTMIIIIILWLSFIWIKSKNDKIKK